MNDPLLSADTLDAGTATRSLDEPPAIGETIGRYELRAVLGTGGMGVVYRAHDPKLARDVALKVLRRRKSTAQRRLREEAQALAAISHPNVVTIHDVGVSRGRVYISMELIEGETLTDWCLRGPSWQQIVGVYALAGRGLEAAHAVGLIHRDFKPDNVMRTPSGRVVVMDFGLALSAGQKSSSHSQDTVDSRPDQTDGLQGTPQYMAPEQFDRSECDERTDVWAFCVSLHEALYGCHPAGGNSLASLMADDLEKRIQSSPGSRKVPARVHRVILRGLHVAPRDRWPSIAKLVDRLSATTGNTRQRWAVPAAGAVLVAAFAVPSPDAKPLEDGGCLANSDQIDAAWGPSVSAKSKTAFVETGHPLANMEFSRVSLMLDGFVGRWKASYESACRARSSGDTSVDAEKWLGCLDRGRQGVMIVADLFADADRRIVNQSTDLALAIPTPESCRKSDAHDRTDRLFTDPSAALAHRRVVMALRRTRVLSMAGRLDEVEHDLREIGDQVRELDHPATTAHFNVAHGELLLQRARYDDAREAFSAAFFEARSVGDSDIAARAATRLVRLVGEQLGDEQGSREWAQHARSVLRDVEDPAEAESSLTNDVAIVKLVHGDVEQGLQLFERLVEIDRERNAPVHEMAAAYVNLAAAQQMAGQYDRARQNALRGLALEVEHFGAEHPEVAHTRVNLANIHYSEGDLEAAIVEAKRARKLLSNALGADSPALWEVDGNLASFLCLSGHATEGLQFADAARNAIASIQGGGSASARSQATFTTVLCLAEVVQAGDAGRLVPDRWDELQRLELSGGWEGPVRTLAALAMARAGHVERAEDLWRPVSESLTLPSDAGGIVGAHLALAAAEVEATLGHAEESRRWLTKAEESISGGSGQWLAHQRHFQARVLKVLGSKREGRTAATAAHRRAR